MPDNVEAELYQHVVWLCENGHPTSWDSIKAIAWQLGKIAGMQGEKICRAKRGGWEFLECTSNYDAILSTWSSNMMLVSIGFGN